MEATFSSVERKVDQTFRMQWVMNFQTFSWVFCDVSKLPLNFYIAFPLPNMWETSNPPTIREYLSKTKRNTCQTNKQTNKNPSQIWRKSNKSTQTLPIGREDVFSHGSSHGKSTHLVQAKSVALPPPPGKWGIPSGLGDGLRGDDFLGILGVSLWFHYYNFQFQLLKCSTWQYPDVFFDVWYDVSEWKW